MLNNEEIERKIMSLYGFVFGSLGFAMAAFFLVLGITLNVTFLVLLSICSLGAGLGALYFFMRLSKKIVLCSNIVMKKQQVVKPKQTIKPEPKLMTPKPKLVKPIEKHEAETSEEKRRKEVEEELEE